MYQVSCQYSGKIFIARTKRKKGVRLCRTLHNKQQVLSASRRTVSSTELRSWKMAEEMLYGEFGFALGMPPSKVKAYLQEKLGS